jgi:hypothetical protein
MSIPEGDLSKGTIAVLISYDGKLAYKPQGRNDLMIGMTAVEWTPAYWTPLP